MAARSKIRALIVDDEAPARARLRQLLAHEQDVEVIGECANGRQALEAIARDKPGVVFLDIQMPGLTGLEVCQALPTAGCPVPVIVFVTAYDRYAVKAFEVHATDYLLKPFDRERLGRTLAHVRRQFADGAQDETRLARVLELLQSIDRRPGRMVFKEDGRLIFLDADQIDWVEADGNYIRIHAGQRSHYVRETLSGIETQLPATTFLRISRSTLVNIARIKEMQPMFYGDYAVILQDGSKLSMSRGYRGRLEGMLRKA